MPARQRDAPTDLPDPHLSPRLYALKPRQQSALLSLAAGATRLATAKRLGVSESAVIRWVALNPDAVAEAAGLVGRRLRNAGADDSVAYLLPDALARLQQIIREGKDGPALQACIEVLTRIFGRVPISIHESRDQGQGQRAVYVRIETISPGPPALLPAPAPLDGPDAPEPADPMPQQAPPLRPTLPMVASPQVRGPSRGRRAYPSDRPVDLELVGP